MTEYVVRSGPWRGTALCVGRVPRRAIDEFFAAHARPEPPRKLAADVGVEVWADPGAEIVDRRDAGYLAVLREWNAAFCAELFERICEVVEVGEVDLERGLGELSELREIGVDAGDVADVAAVLRHVVLEDEDADALVDLVLYNSTVTDRGLAEAAARYDVTWGDVRVRPFRRARGRAITASHEFNDRQAATWAGYRWEEFCALGGPEQSSVAAQHALAARLW